MNVNPNARRLKRSPYDGAGIFSRLLFSWMYPLFTIGNARHLCVEDIYQLPEEDGSAYLGTILERKWITECEESDSFTFHKALIKQFCKPYAVCSFLILIVDLVLRLASPVILSLFIQTFNTQDTPGIYLKCLLGMLLSLTFLLTCIGYHFERFCSSHLGLKIRVAIHSLIYSKIVKLSKMSLQDSGEGHVTNLLTNDVFKMEILPTFLNYLWSTILQTVLGIVIMWHYIGPFSCVGGVLLLISVPLQGQIAKKYSTLRAASLPIADVRLMLMNEIISGIKTIKANGWEDIFSKSIRKVRREEVQILTKAFNYRAVNMALYFFTTKLITFCTLYPYYLKHQSVSPDQIFTVVSILGVLRFSLTLLWPLAFSTYMESKIAAGRIQSFLNLEERNPEYFRTCSSELPLDVINLNAEWNSEDSLILKNISFRIQKGQVTGIVGKVGSGKSSLLQAIAGEMKITSGQVCLGGRVNYLSPDPWLFEGSIRENILSGGKMNFDVYNQVMKITQLQKDLDTSSLNEFTMIRQSGENLSGGQRSRVHLARCLYRSADIYMLDNPFASLDSKIGNEVFVSCIEYLAKQNKTVLLITNRQTYLSLLDNIIVLRNGELVASGSFNELSSQGICINNFLDQPLHKPDLCCEEEGPENEIANGHKHEQKDPTHKVSTRRISRKAYWTYITSSGYSYKLLILVIVLSLGSQFLSTGVDVWIAYWTKTIGATDVSFHNWISPYEANIIYLTMIVLTILITFPKSVLFFRICIKSAETIHNRMIDRVLHSPLYFFENEQIGSVLQCCSKDMAIVDDLLPRTLDDVVTIFLLIFGASVTVALASYWSLVLSCIIGILFYVVVKYFMKTCRALKRLESKVRGPLLNNVITIIKGITTLRNFQMERVFCEKFNAQLDLYTSASFLFMCATRCLSLIVDFLMNMYFSVVILLFIVFQQDGEAENVGLALSCILSLGISFQWAARQSAELENRMVSVERILEAGYSTDVKQSAPLYQDPSEPKIDNWPSSGMINFENVSICYRDALVLKPTSFTIRPGEKVGIIGRTGAGKTSLLAALMKHVNYFGTITLDDYNIQCVDPGFLRSQVFYIPQDSALFSGSLRFNIDPTFEYSDEQIFSALEKVCYPGARKNLALDLVIKKDGSNISSGNRQLISLARIFLKKSKLIILDEATSKIDLEVEEQILSNLGIYFNLSTILFVTHRMDNLMKMDKVMVISGGSVQEFDSPSILLENPSSSFQQFISSSRSLRCE